MVTIELGEIKTEMDYCVMSEDPIKFGIGIKITDPLWTKIKKEKKFLFDHIEAKITDEIDIGDRTWFIFELKNQKISKNYI